MLKWHTRNQNYRGYLGQLKGGQSLHSWKFRGVKIIDKIEEPPSLGVAKDPSTEGKHK